MTKSITACPMMNIFLAQKKISHTNISKTNIDTALQYIKLDPILIYMLKLLFPRENILSIHTLEHELSLTRLDAADGNPILFNKARYNLMKSFSSDNKYISLDELVNYMNYLRIQNKYYIPIKTTNACIVEASILYVLLRDTNNKMPLKWLDCFYIKEKLPFKYGYKIRQISVTDFMSTLIYMFSRIILNI